MSNKKKLIKIINIPKIKDDCFLYFAENKNNIPFEIKRVYYILQANPLLPRGLHSHYTTDQVLFCIKGSIKITLDDGFSKDKIILNKPEIGILIPRMTWHEMTNFKKNTILLVLASKEYDPKDYIRNYDLFIKLINENKH